MWSNAIFILIPSVVEAFWCGCNMFPKSWSSDRLIIRSRYIFSRMEYAGSCWHLSSLNNVASIRLRCWPVQHENGIKMWLNSVGQKQICLQNFLFQIKVILFASCTTTYQLKQGLYILKRSVMLSSFRLHEWSPCMTVHCSAVQLQ